MSHEIVLVLSSSFLTTRKWGGRIPEEALTLKERGLSCIFQQKEILVLALKEGAISVGSPGSGDL
jgi:hypothetical protein